MAVVAFTFNNNKPLQMNQIQSELRLARNLIAERDSEVQSIRTTNNQYVEENERLRAILGEWSARAAKQALIYLTCLLSMYKLERALEAERLTNMELQKKMAEKEREWKRVKPENLKQVILANVVIQM
ncbi:hypothetical protein ACLOJK_025159 [Asimina triloba]